MASSSAITTRVGTMGSLLSGSVSDQAGSASEPVEQIVLGPLELVDLGRPRESRWRRHRVGVPLGLAVLLLGQRRLRHERPQAGLVGLLGELRELLVGDPQLLTELAQARGEVLEAALHAANGTRSAV